MPSKGYSDAAAAASRRRELRAERKAETESQLELQRAVAQLELRVAELEQRPAAAFRYRGTWSPKETYQPGNFCTRRGSMWACQERNCDAMPGESKAWTLAVKQGRDRRDR